MVAPRNLILIKLGSAPLVQGALQSAVRRSDRAWGLYELNHGLHLALDEKNRRTAWSLGEESLAPVIPDLDMRVMAATFDTFLSATARP
jgi:hypothetical protein